MDSRGNLCHPTSLRWNLIDIFLRQQHIKTEPPISACWWSQGFKQKLIVCLFVGLCYHINTSRRCLIEILYCSERNRKWKHLWWDNLVVSGLQCTVSDVHKNMTTFLTCLQLLFYLISTSTLVQRSEHTDKTWNVWPDNKGCWQQCYCTFRLVSMREMDGFS